MANNSKKIADEVLKHFGNKQNSNGAPKTPSGKAVKGSVEDLVADIEKTLAVAVGNVLFGKKAGITSFNQLKSAAGNDSILNTTLNDIKDAVTNDANNADNAEFKKSLLNAVNIISKNSELSYNIISSGFESLNDAITNYKEHLKTEDERIINVSVQNPIDYNDKFTSIENIIAELSNKLGMDVASGSSSEIAINYKSDESMNKLFEMIAGLSDDNIKTMQNIATSLDKINTVDVSNIAPISDMLGAFLDNIISNESKTEQAYNVLQKINAMTDSNSELNAIYNNMANLNVASSSVFDEIYEIGLMIDTVAAIGKYVNMDDIYASEEKFIGVNTLFDDKCALRELIDNLSSITADTNVANAACDSLSKMFALILQATEVRTKDIDKAKLNIDAFKGLVIHIQQVLDEIEKTDFDSKLTAVSKQFDSLDEFYREKIHKMAEDGKSTAADIAVINGNLDKTTEINSHLQDEKQSESDSDKAAAMMSAVAACGLVMLVGGLIMSAYPKLVTGSFKFAVSLTAFLLMVSIPIVLMSRLMSDEKIAETIDSMGGLIAKCTFIMLIGGAFMMWGGGKYVKGALQFGKVLTLFLVMILVPIAIAGFIMGDGGKTFEGVAKVIKTATIIMIVGALFMMLGGGKYAEAAIAFGKLLTIFLALVLIPITIFGLLTTFAGKAIESINKIIITCAIVMSVGALFMMLGGGKFVVNALAFGVLLAVFIGLVLAPFAILATNPMFALSFAALHTLSKFIVKATIILLVGALFMMLGGGKFVIAALAFTLLLKTFIELILQPIIKNAIFLQAAYKGIMSFSLLIVAAGGILLFAGSMLADRPIMLVWILAFALILDLFIYLTIKAISSQAAKLTKAMPALMNFTVFIVAAAAVLLIGASFIEKYGVLSILVFAVLFEVFILANVGIMKILNKANLKKSLKDAQILALVIAEFAGAMALAILAMQLGGDWKNTAIYLGEFAIAVLVLGGTFWGLQKILKGVNMPRLVTITEMMTTAIAGLGIAFGLAIVAMRLGGDWKNTAIYLAEFVAATAVMATVFGIIGLKPLYKKILTGSIVAQDMGIAIGLLGLAFGLAVVAMRLGGDPLATLEYLGIFVAATALMATVFGIIGIPVLGAAVLIGSIVAAGMGVAIGSLGIAFGLAIVAMRLGGSPEETMNYLNTFIGATILLTEIMAIIGFPVIAVLATLGAVAGTAMGIAITALSVGFGLAIVAMRLGGDPETTKQYIETFKDATEQMSLIMLIIGNPIMIAVAGMAAIAGGLIAAAMIPLSLALLMYVDVCKIAAEVKDYKVIGKIISGFADSLPDGKTIGKLMWNVFKLSVVSPAIMRVSKMIAHVSKTIADVANLKVATAWDKDGNPTAYRHLNKQDFKLAADGVSIIISTLVEAVAKAWVNEINFAGEKKPICHIMTPWYFGKIINAFTGLGDMLSAIADGVASYATMMIPTKWNSDGKAIAFRQLNKRDFALVKDNVGELIKTLVTAVITAWETPIHFIGEEIPLYLAMSPDKFGKIVDAFAGIGGMIGSIAEGIVSYASGTIPIKWDKDGKPVQFRKLSNSDYLKSSETIGAIINNLVMSISDTWDNMAISVSKLGKMNEALSPMGEMIANMASGIISYASGTVPIKWDKDGKAIDFMRLTDADYIKASVAIGKIIDLLVMSISKTWDEMPISIDKLGKMMKALEPMGNLISGLANGIQTYANLSTPIYEYDSRKKELHIVGYNKLTDADLEAASINIGKVIMHTVFAISAAYAMAEKIMGEDAWETGFNAINGVGSLVSSTAQGLEAYAKLAFPIYDDKGKIIGYEKLKPSDFEEAGKNIGAVMTGVIDAIIAVYNNNKSMFNTSNLWFSKDDESPIAKVITAISGVGGVIKSVVEAIEGYANLKIVTGWDKNGKPTGYISVNKEWLNEAKTNIGLIIETLCSSLLTAYNNTSVSECISDAGKLKLEQISETIQSITGVIGSIVDVIQSIADMKVPTAWNADGTPSKYRVLKTSDIDTLNKNVDKIITSVPAAVLKAYEGGVDEDNNSVFDTTINAPKFNAIVETLRNVQTVIMEVSGVIETLLDPNISKNMKNILTRKAVSTTDKEDIKALPGMFIDIYNIVSGISAINNALGTISPIENDFSKLVDCIANVTDITNVVIDTAVNINESYIELPKNFVADFIGTNNDGRLDDVLKLTNDMVDFVNAYVTLISDNQKQLTAFEKIDNIKIALIFNDVAMLSNELFKGYENIMNSYNADLMAKRETYTVTTGKLFWKTDKEVAVLVRDINNILGDIFDIMTLTDNYDWNRKFDIDGALLVMWQVELLTESMFRTFNNVMTTTGKALALGNVYDRFDIIKLQMAAIINNMREIFDPSYAWLTDDYAKNTFYWAFAHASENFQKVWASAMMFTESIKAIYDASVIAKKINPVTFDYVVYTLSNISKLADDADPQAILNFKKEIKEVGEFVKVINKINVEKVSKFDKLINDIDKMAKSIGSLDKFASTLSDKLANTLTSLTNEIIEARKVIKDADKLQANRHELIERSARNLKDIMDGTLNIVVKSGDNDNMNASATVINEIQTTSHRGGSR